jgi:predicted DNA binding protein
MIEADVTLPAATIPPGTALAATNTHVEFIGRIPVEGVDGQYLRVTDSEDREAFADAARFHPGVESLTAIDRDPTSYYHLTWHNSPPCPAVYRSDLVVERMEGTPEGWSFRLRAGNGEALQSLQGDCRDRDAPFQVDRLDRSTEGTDAGSATDSYGLTAKQRAVLMTAIEAGFFAIPRETTLAELAEELDISDQAVSDHLRRAQWNVLQATVLAD